MASLNGSCCRAWMAGITVEVPILCELSMCDLFDMDVELCGFLLT